MQEYPSSEARRDTNSMILDAIGPPNNRSRFQLGRYSDLYWNNDSVITNNNNCYSYACNIRVNSSIPDPGCRKYRRLVTSQDELEQGILYDGLIKIDDDQGADPQVNGTNEHPAWIVVLFAGFTKNEFGYHFFRKVWSGNGSDCNNGEECYWSHKFYTERVTNKTHGGTDKIKDATVEMNKLNNVHNVNMHRVGLYLVSPTTTIGTC